MDYIIDNCPHCDITIMIKKENFNCKVLRCGIYKNNFKQVHPHLDKSNCDQLVKNKLVYGCCKPFKIDENNKLIKCGYI